MFLQSRLFFKLCIYTAGQIYIALWCDGAILLLLRLHRGHGSCFFILVRVKLCAVIICVCVVLRKLKLSAAEFWGFFLLLITISSIRVSAFEGCVCAYSMVHCVQIRTHTAHTNREQWQQSKRQQQQQQWALHSIFFNQVGLLNNSKIHTQTQTKSWKKKIKKAAGEAEKRNKTQQTSII